MKVYLIINNDETYKYILSSKQLANKVRERFPDEFFNRPEEITIDNCPIRPDGELFYVIMSKEGTVEDIYIEELIIDYKDHYNVEGINFDVNDDLFTWVWVMSEDEAVSIVDNMRTKLIESNKWGKCSWES